MGDKLIIYKDVGQREVGAVIDLGESDRLAKSKIGSFGGKSVQQINGNINSTVEKTHEISKAERKH